MKYQEVSKEELENRVKFLDSRVKVKGDELLKLIQVLEVDYLELIDLQTEIDKRK